jgi:hypothetical protein
MKYDTEITDLFSLNGDQFVNSFLFGLVVKYVFIVTRKE